MEVSDEEIIILLKEKPDRAIELLFKKYYKYLCGEVSKYLRDKVQVEDIVQDVFQNFWIKRESINIDSNIRAYLKRACINKTINSIKKKKLDTDSNAEIDKVNQFTPSTQLSMEGQELSVFINNAIDSLPERCRMVFAMSRFDELSYKEIGAKLDISPKTVENQVSKALKILRVEYQKFKNL